MLQARARARLLAYENNIYVFGGLSLQDVCLNTVEKFDPETGKWSYVEAMLTKRSRYGVASFNGKIYVCGGFDGARYLRSAEVYDLNTDKWAFIAEMRYKRCGCAVFQHSGYLFVVGGYNKRTNLNTIEMYIPETNQWKVV